MDPPASPASKNGGYNDEVVDTTVDYDTTLETIDQGDDEERSPSQDAHSEQAINNVVNSIKTKKSTATLTKRPSVNVDTGEDTIEEESGNEGDNETDGEGEEPKKDDPKEVDHKQSVEKEGDEGEDGDDSGKDDDDEEEEEEEEPPKLKYTRLTQLPARFFNKDPVSAFLVDEHVFIFATHSGIIHLCRPDFTPIRTFKSQMTSILSLHTDGEYFASASMDGTVVIGSIKDESDITKFDFKRPVYSVALDRQYKSTKSFFTGGTSGKLIHSMRGWLGKRQDDVIDSEGGPITMIKMVDDLIFWTNDLGIHIMQVTTGTKLMDLSLPKNFPRPEMYWPRAQLVDRDRLMIAWANYIWVFRISVIGGGGNKSQASKILSSAASSLMPSTDEKRINLERHVKLDDTLVAGVSMFNDDLLVLNYIAAKETLNEQTGRKLLVGQPPELEIVDRVNLEPQSVDEVALNGYQMLGFNDYHLEEYVSGKEGPQWFLVSANDAVVVQEFGLQDRLTWYTAKGKYLEAWNMSALWLDKLDRMNIGLKQVEKYTSSNDWGAAGEFLGKVLEINPADDSKDTAAKLASEWNSYLSEFLKENQLEAIEDHMPSVMFSYPDVSIDGKYYDDVLDHCLEEKQYDEFRNLVEKWDHRLFDVNDATEKIGSILIENDHDHSLQEAMTTSVDFDDPITKLREMYVDLSDELDKPQQCVDHLIRLHDKELLQFLDEHHMIEQNLEKLPAVITVVVDDPAELESKDIAKLRQDLSTEIQILVENSHEIVPQKIVGVLDDAGMDYISYLYLEKLSQEDSALVKDLENEMVVLYASYDREDLSDFLSKHKNYSIDQAITVCQEKHCTHELVYLLHKVGENKKAMMLIIDELDDPTMAIQFAESLSDQDLWDFLLDHSMKRPDFVRALLEAAGDLIDPIPVVSRIPDGVEIEGLKSALVNITRNMDLDDQIYQIILDIISKDTVATESVYNNLRLHGRAFDHFDSRIRSTMQTFIEMPASSGEKGLVTEEEYLGTESLWQGEATDPAGKIKHMSYIKGRMMLAKMQQQQRPQY